MNTDDFIYLFFLFFSISFGLYYRKLKNAETKKNIGALVGFFMVLGVSKLHTLHILCTIFGNALICLFADRRYCHLASFFFSFLYLIFFRTTAYFGIPYPPSHTNLIQMLLTLKLVGLNFELNSAYLLKKAKEAESEDESDEDVWGTFNLTFSDILCYGLHYVGVLTGPYYKYRTYYDHLYKSFNKYDDYKSITLQKLLPQIPCFALLYLITDNLWPLSYCTTINFEQRSFLYRYWYIWPTFFTFRMRIYIGLILSECVCIMAGLGIYPSCVKSKPGHGPTENLNLMNKICNDEESLKTVEYDYNTVHNINPYDADFSPTLREGMKNWNLTVQYWLVMCIYKRFPNKQFRTLVTMLVSALWHGVYTGYYVSFTLVTFGMIVEDIWAQLLLKEYRILPEKIGHFIMWFFKMQLFSYAAMAFGLLHVNKILHYYNSVYHWIIPLYIALYIGGRKLLQNCKAKNIEPKTK